MAMKMVVLMTMIKVTSMMMVMMMMMVMTWMKTMMINVNYDEVMYDQIFLSKPYV